MRFVSAVVLSFSTVAVTTGCALAQPLSETVPNLTKTPQELFKERRLSPDEVAVLVSKAIRDMQPDREPTVRSEAIRSLIPMGAQADTALPPESYGAV